MKYLENKAQDEYKNDQDFETAKEADQALDILVTRIVQEMKTIVNRYKRIGTKDPEVLDQIFGAIRRQL